MEKSHPPSHLGRALPAWDERDIDRLQTLLDSVPAPLEPLDVSMLDGFLCGVLLQPQRVTPEQWWSYVVDVDGRLLPRNFDPRELKQLVDRRYDELNQAIAQRSWFDPWVFELHGDDNSDAALEEGADDAPTTIDAVYPWVAGFAAAAGLFPGLMDLDEGQLTEPLALLYQHLDAEDLEDADALLAEIETLEPPEDLADAVEQLVRATLLLADISRPLRAKPAPASQRHARPKPRGKAPRR